ncbi:MAG: phospho-N-acetylmuramoyl-pentapeptide-transferase [Chitinophagales bacterium]|jgi:phospho-N-acetylmuramoyl-pentapeptide-transferase|nr:phospho-N-acetylmuramoyl-pentapeptide-transferase [Chitinophagales bacterium]
MIYYLLQLLDRYCDLPQLFFYISFRAALATILSLLITVTFGGKIIELIRQKQIGETVRDLGLPGQNEKSGTPTMGGLIILSGIILPTLLVANLSNVYVWMLLIVSVWLGGLGFMDDYIKVFRKNKEGLKGKYKIVGQIGAGIFVASLMYYHPDIKVRDVKQIFIYASQDGKIIDGYNPVSVMNSKQERIVKDSLANGLIYSHNTKKLATNIPFVKGNNFYYDTLFHNLRIPGYLHIIPLAFIIIFIITAVSNGANITDGIDGLAAGTSGIVGMTLLVLSYVAGNYIFANYLNVLFLPNIAEVTIFLSAFVASCIGFLWWNSYPAQIFMGDTGSLALGGIIATVAIIIRKELMIPVICGVFLVENLSVIIQVTYFKWTKKRFGEGRRIFLMSPLHHHFQQKKIHENKIVFRFLIVAMFLAVLSIITLKVR